MTCACSITSRQVFSQICRLICPRLDELSKWVERQACESIDKVLVTEENCNFGCTTTSNHHDHSRLHNIQHQITFLFSSSSCLLHSGQIQFSTKAASQSSGAYLQLFALFFPSLYGILRCLSIFPFCQLFVTALCSLQSSGIPVLAYCIYQAWLGRPSSRSALTGWTVNW